MARETRTGSNSGPAAKARRTWNEWLEDYVQFVNEQARHPSQHANHHSERLLHYWLRNQKASLRSGLLTPDRAAMLNKELPGWNTDRLPHPAWDERLARAVAFHAETGQWPSLTSSDPDERALAAWLHRQAANRTAARDRRHAERVAKLDRLLPGWRARSRSEKKRWESQLEQIVEHLRTHGRPPIMGPASSPMEYALAKWISTQSYAQKKGRLSPERAARLDEIIPGWRHSHGREQSESKPGASSRPKGISPRSQGDGS